MERWQYDVGIIVAKKELMMIKMCIRELHIANEETEKNVSPGVLMVSE